MAKIKARAFLSPTLVLLAMDWEEGKNIEDFLGFAIKRTPGFRAKQGEPLAQSDWLRNRIGFNGPNEKGDVASNINPIQHFQWWDGGIDTEDRGSKFTYEIFPVTGTPDNLKLHEGNSTVIECTIPQIEQNNIGTYFNRAVVSSQAFSKEFGEIKTEKEYLAALDWLSNGMSSAITNFIDDSKGSGLFGVAYHLTDHIWTLPKLLEYKSPASLVVFFKAPSATGKSKGDPANVPLKKFFKNNKKISLFNRTKTSLMHDKFIVRSKSDKLKDATHLLMGTANFTTEGLTQQANVIHTFNSPELAAFYLERQIFLQDDPTKSDTAKEAKWSKKVKVGDANVRVFFAPEGPAGNAKTGKKGSRNSIDNVVNAVKNASSSVMFSLFSATDKELLDACTAAANNGLLMRGLVNRISSDDPSATDDEDTPDASQVAATILYESSQNDNMVVGHDSFGKNNTPTGFWWEKNSIQDPSLPKPQPGEKKKSAPPVFVHQKIVIIDGETDNPTIFVGSANLSNNSTWHNDENMLEITNCDRLGKIYVAEFMRLYEQYRARFSWNKWHEIAGENAPKTYTLRTDNSWAKKDYTDGTMQNLSMKKFAGS